MSDVELKMTGLQKLLKAFKGKQPIARVGILGSTANREEGNPNNATIGAIHEFGMGVPMRSFLRVPIADNLQAKLQQSGVFDKPLLKKVVEKGAVKPWLEQIAVLAESVVLEGFDSGGYGKWAPLSPATLAHKKVHQILVESQQLRNSITSEVVDG